MKHRAHPLAKIALLTIAGACLVGALALSCTRKPQGPGLYRTASELMPAANPGPEASLLIAGTPIPVELEHKVEGQDVTIRLITLGQEIEVEKYRSDGSKFVLVQAASEKFEKPLPLLDFPVMEKQQLMWTGKLLIGELGKDASAVTTITKDNLNEPGLNGEAVKCSVELSFDGGAPKPTTRLLTFWFMPSKGIVKRVFDKGSTRAPSPPESLATEKPEE